MILSNLSAIMGRKQLKIAQVMTATGISRPTLTNLYYNQGKGINFDTFSLLCQFLQVTPGELFTYYPFEITIEIDVNQQAEEKQYQINGMVHLDGANLDIDLKAVAYYQEDATQGDVYVGNLDYTLVYDEKKIASIIDDNVLVYIKKIVKEAMIGKLKELGLNCATTFIALY